MVVAVAGEEVTAAVSQTVVVLSQGEPSQVVVVTAVQEAPDTQIFQLVTIFAPCISDGVPELSSVRIRRHVRGRMFMRHALANETVTNSAHKN